MPSIAQSCPSIDAVQDAMNEIKRRAEDLEQFVDDRYAEDGANELWFIIECADEVIDHVEDTRSINSQLRDALTELAEDHLRLVQEFESVETMGDSLQSLVNDLERMLQEAEND